MVLAIGLLVDDAIVVVENVERVMHEQNVDARQATGTAIAGIKVARQLCKNKNMTIMTRTIASAKVLITPFTDVRYIWCVERTWL
jgi:Cu/Ag efflux pump CusA